MPQNGSYMEENPFEEPLDYGSFHDDSEHHSKAKHKDEEDHFELVNEECEVDASDQPA